MTIAGRGGGRQVLMAAVGHDLVTGECSAAHLQRLFERVGDALGFEIFLHFRLLDSHDRLTLVASAGLEPAVAERLRTIGVGEGVCGAVASRRERLVLENAAALRADAAAELRELGVRCYVGVPLIARGELLGTLAFATAAKRTKVRIPELELIEMFGSQVASQLARQRSERQLEQASDALRRANRAKDEFLAILAHELRNPLAPIRNAVEVLKLAAPDNAGVSRAGEIIDRQVTYLARLVDDLLDAARIARGKIALKSERVDLVAVVQQAIETCRPLLLAAQHELVVTLRDEPCFVVGDSMRLAQVVSNLITNAAKFTAAGGRIEVILDRADGNAVVRVRDNGRGMDAATLANVFDMFYQSTREGDRSVGGLGIGLALVRSLVALHRGQVEAVSDGRGRGSEFIVRLPCVDNAAPADRARLEGEFGPLRTARG